MITSSNALRRCEQGPTSPRCESVEHCPGVGELTGLALINGKAALEGTFLGPCIVTGRVAARAVLQELSVKPPASAVEEQRCVDCHEVSNRLERDRPGYWHFEKAHRAADTRGLDCRQCHSELSPYRPDRHRLNWSSLSTSCLLCHMAQE